MKTIKAADLFCGAGGTSTGLAYACEDIGAKLELIAINHWDVAIETHSKNHPGAKHLCESLDNVDPRKLVSGGHLQLLVASPECTHHSMARGGKPMSDQSRASGWHILRWAEAIRIDNILIENVREYESWGPLGANGRPLKSKRGETFRAFLDALRSLNYTVDYRILNAADYGDPTTRERLFIMARRGRKSITWPEPTHTRDGESTLFGDAPKKWRAAREIIDWNIPGESIFARKKPLAPATMARIAAGLRKFGGAKAEPFLVVLRNHAEARSIDKPLPTLTAGGQHFALCEPFVLGQQSGASPRSVDKPLPTIATGGAISLVQPFLMHLNRPGDRPRQVDEPIATVTGTSSDFGLVEPFIVPVNHGKADHRTYSMDRPMPTVTTLDAWGMVQPFLVEYYGTGGSRSVDDPVATITAKDRFGLIQVDGLALDIRFRMLQPHELARAMSFPDGYEFAGTRDQKVKQIGNAVPRRLAQALCRELIGDAVSARKEIAA